MSVIRPNIATAAIDGVVTVQNLDDPTVRTLVLTGLGLNTAANNTRIAAWLGSGGTVDYEFPSSVVKWASDNAADTNNIYVTGTDLNYVLQTETVTLNGVTPVNSAFSWSAINEAYAVNQVLGTITCKNPALTVTYAIIAGAASNPFVPNSWPMGWFSNYVIPVGYVGVVSGLQSWAINAGNQSASSGISVKDFTESPAIFRPVADWTPTLVGAGNADPRTNILTRPMAFREKTAIQWRTSAPGVGTLTVYTSMTLSLVPQGA